MTTRWAILFLWVGCAAVAGCSYRFVAGGPALPAGVFSLYVPVMSNATAEPGAELFFTDALRARVARMGKEGGEGADGRIEGEVRSVSGAPGVAGPGGRGARNRLTITVHLALLKAGQTLRQTDITGTEDYVPDPDSDVLKVEASRQAALRRLADSLMREAYDRLLTGG